MESHKHKTTNQLILVSASKRQSEGEKHISDASSACRYLSFCPQECSYINTHVTAPGAIVALGLAFLKTNDRY